MKTKDYHNQTTAFINETGELVDMKFYQCNDYFNKASLNFSRLLRSRKVTPERLK